MWIRKVLIFFLIERWTQPMKQLQTKLEELNWSINRKILGDLSSRSTARSPVETVTAVSLINGLMVLYNVHDRQCQISLIFCYVSIFELSSILTQNTDWLRNCELCLQQGHGIILRLDVVQNTYTPVGLVRGWLYWCIALCGSITTHPRCKVRQHTGPVHDTDLSTGMCGGHVVK